MMIDERKRERLCRNKRLLDHLSISFFGLDLVTLLEYSYDLNIHPFRCSSPNQSGTRRNLLAKHSPEKYAKSKELRIFSQILIQRCLLYAETSTCISKVIKETRNGIFIYTYIP